MTHEQIVQAARNNQFVQFCGIELHRHEAGDYYMTVNIEPHHHNPYGIVHGGLLYTMADTVAGSNARRFCAHPVTLDSDFHFFKNVESGTLTATAEAVHTGHTILLFRVRITADTGEVLAEGTFTYFNKQEKPNG